MWQRFTERARRVILLGQEEAGKMSSGHVGTEHLLLGLVRENEGAASQILQKMGVSLVEVRRQVEAEVRPGSEAGSGEPKLTPKAKRVLELAADEARRMRHNYIGTEHLLIALLREKNGLAAVVLRRMGLDLEKARKHVLEYVGPADYERAPSPTVITTPTFSYGYGASTPEAEVVRDLTIFVTNLNAGLAFPENLHLVYGARLGYFGANEWARSWNQSRLQHRISLRDISVTIEEEDARVKVTYDVGAPSEKEALLVRSGDSALWTEELTLRLGPAQEGQRQWQIVPMEQFPLSEGTSQTTLLAQATFALAQKESVSASLVAARQSQLRLKHLCLAALQFTADWSDSFAFDAQYLREALLPYLKNQEIFVIPQTLEPYTFNESLSGKSLNDIPDPSQTILFYEGKEQDLIFRYEGKAVIATANGRCLIVTPEQAQQFIWTP